MKYDNICYLKGGAMHKRIANESESEIDEDLVVDSNNWFHSNISMNIMNRNRNSFPFPDSRSLEVNGALLLFFELFVYLVYCWFLFHFLPLVLGNYTLPIFFKKFVSCPKTNAKEKWKTKIYDNESLDLLAPFISTFS